MAITRSAQLAIMNIGQLVTLAGPARPRVGEEMRELGLVRDGAMLIQDGRVAEVGAYADLKVNAGRAIAQGAVVLDAGGSLVTPGFVDAHTHLVFAGNRATYQEIAAAGGGIQSTVALTRGATDDELHTAARRHREWMLRGGTTTLEAKSGYGLNLESELRILRVITRLGEEALQPDAIQRIVPTLLAAHTVPKEYADRREDYLRLVIDEIIPEVGKLRLARYCDAFCDDHAFTVEETRRVLEAAQRHGLGLRLHAEQFRPGTGAALAAELHAATADHLETVTDETLLKLKAAGVQPVLLPASVFCLSRDQYSPTRRMIELGLPVVLATDFNPGSSPATSMPFIMTLACLQMKMLPAEALTASTINAAYSLSLGDQVGSLEPGKAADFLIHEATDYRELAYYAAAAMRPRVFIGGTEVTP